MVVILPLMLLLTGTEPGTFDFPGGTAAELAVAVEKEARVPVVILMSDDRKLRAAKFQWENRDDLRRQIGSYFGFRLAPGQTAFGFNQGAFPASSLLTTSGASRSATTGSVTTKDGTLSAAGGPYVAGAVASSAGSNVPSFFRVVPIAVAASEAPFKDVGMALKAALALTSDDPALPDPTRFPAMVAAGWQLVAAQQKTPLDRARAEFTREVVLAADPKAVAGLYTDFPVGIQVSTRPRTVLQRRAYDLLALALQSFSRPGGRPLLDPRQVSLDEPVEIRLDPGQFVIPVYRIGNRTLPLPIAPVPIG